MHARSPWLVATACLLTVALAACGGGGSGSGLSTLQVRLQDTPVDEADSVFVTVDRVDVIRLDGSGNEVVETLVSTPAQYDLLVLQNGVSAVLGTGEFPAGDYTSIRLIVAADTPQDIATLPADQLNNYIVVEGVPYPLIVPSGAQTGIKMNHAFTLSPSEITVLTLDFDVRQSVHQRGHQGIFNLRPTVRLVDTVVSGTVSGTLSTSDGSALPAGCVVSAQRAGVEVASAVADATSGAYQIGPLLAGTYDLIVVAPGYALQAGIGVAVTAQADSGGHDFVLAPASTGDLTGTVSVTTTLPDSVTVRLLWNGLVVATMGIDASTGAYAFFGVPVGDYTVEATDGIAAATGTGAVTAGAATVVDLTLP